MGKTFVPTNTTDDLIEHLRQKAKGERNALGDYWGDWLCDKAAAELTRLQARVAELEAENARLANDYNVARDAQDRRARELAKVRAENSGLVQTVRDAADYLRRAEASAKELEAESARLLALHKSTMGDADARLERAEAERDRLKAAADEWQMQAEQAEAVQDALRADAERWDMFAALWAACTELQATQDEDGRWSLTCIEPVEGVPEPGRWTGDDPDAAIDAVRGKGATHEQENEVHSTEPRSTGFRGNGASRQDGPVLR